MPVDDDGGDEKIEEVDTTSNEGEQRIFAALMDLASTAEKLADDMKSYDYPTDDEVEILLKQESYTPNDLKQKTLMAEKRIHGILEDVDKMKVWIKTLKNKVNEAQKLCYLNEMYDVLRGTDKDTKDRTALVKIFQRKEEQKKLRAKRDKEKENIKRKEFNHYMEPLPKLLKHLIVLGGTEVNWCNL